MAIRLCVQQVPKKIQLYLRAGQERNLCIFPTSNQSRTRRDATKRIGEAIEPTNGWNLLRCEAFLFISCFANELFPDFLRNPKRALALGRSEHGAALGL